MFRKREAPMEPGMRTRRVTIQYRTAMTAGGFPEDDWTTQTSVTVPMSREAVLGMERDAMNQLTAKTTVRWEMTYRSDMDPELVDVPRERRLVHEGRTYDILAANRIGAKEGIELMTLAKVG